MLNIIDLHYELFEAVMYKYWLRNQYLCCLSLHLFQDTVFTRNTQIQLNQLVVFHVNPFPFIRETVYYK